MIGAAIGAAGSLAQTLYGAVSLLSQGDSPERPTYVRPEEIDAITNISKARAYSGEMPGYQNFLGEIGGSRAAAMTEGKKIGNFDVSSLYEKELESMRRMQTQNAAYKIDQEDKLKGALEMLAMFKDKEFAYNKSGKYLDEKADWNARRNEGFGMLQGGLSGLTGGGLDSLFGGKGGLGDAFGV